jgi:ATP-dependent DNA helicase RecG
MRVTGDSKRTSGREAWDLQVQFLKGVGEKLAALLSKADIQSLWDLLLTLPKNFEDRRKFSSFDDMLRAQVEGRSILGKARICDITFKKAGLKGRKWVELWAELDEPAKPIVMFTFFNDYGGSLSKRYPVDTHVIFQGKPQFFRSQLQFVHPELILATGELPWWELGWIPVYKEVSGISTKVLRKIVAQALDKEEFARIPESLSPEICRRHDLPPLAESLRQLHFPTKWEPSLQNELRPEGKYFRRVVFEELFMMALALHLRRAAWRARDLREGQQVPEISIASGVLDKIKSSLPFKLTQDQSNTLTEIYADLAAQEDHVPMHRMVQGDVGSGKTIVAFLAAIAANESGYQAALMAPTEILADQHYQNFKKMFPDRAGEALLLKGALTAKTKREARALIQSGGARFIIGTQALLTDDTLFEKLGLVIVDEQHRFGVEQRLNLKGGTSKISPHLLVMTATPIPRSLALTLYGDLNLSLIRQKPAGRIAIATHMVKQRQREALVKRLRKFVEEGRQLYLVYPLVEESEELDLKDVQSSYLEWKKAFPEVQVDLLHGRMKSSEKEKIMARFKAGETKVLVSTTVIEVGVDVPNASVIVIEHAERFGLSQLHQLRGRVGRGAEQSYCVLVAPDSISETVEQRLKIMVDSDDGFAIAEKDLDIRGPGEFLGRRQSGMPGFRVAHILRDVALMGEAREEARKILAEDPKLETSKNAKLRLLIEKWWTGRMELTLSG